MCYCVCVGGQLGRTPGVGPVKVDKLSYAEELKAQMKINEEKKLEERRVSLFRREGPSVFLLLPHQSHVC